MKRSIFLLIAALLSFLFGVLLFFLPAVAAGSWGMHPAAETLSVIRGMGGLIIGYGLMNFFARNYPDGEPLKALLWTNLLTHTLGLAADIWGLADGVLTAAKIAPVEITHLFVGAGSAIFLFQLKIRKSS